jgi:hypothetical protein
MKQATTRTRLWLTRMGLVAVGLGAGTILGRFAITARHALELGPEHALGLGVGAVVALWIAADL